MLCGVLCGVPRPDWRDHGRSCVSARHISSISVTIGLLLIWTNAAFWSAAPLLGWGSYTGRRDLYTQSLATPPLALTLRTAPRLRSRLRHV